MPKPVFLVSAPRSGSTLGIALLDSHPRVAMTNEAGWVTFLRKTFLLASTPAMRTIDDGEGFTTPGILPERYTRQFAGAYETTMRPFVGEFFSRVVEKRDYDWYGDKVMSVNDLDFAIERFPEAAFVQLVRDPRDVLVSSYAFQQKQPTAWQDSTFEMRIGHLETFLRRTDEQLAGRQNLFLRYEELIADPEGRAAAVFEFLGLDVTEEVRTFLRETSQRLFERQGTSASPDATIGRWRRDLPPAQQERANEVLGAQLRRLGYDV